MGFITTLFSDGNARLMASVVAFVAFFLIARLIRARQTVAFAFAFTPLLLISAVITAVATGAL